MSPSVSDNLLADRYQLIEPIGIGGMAEVHRAWDRVLRRHVAVKVFQPGFDPAAAQRFDNEVRVLAGLSHPGLVSVYDADTGAATPFVVLRLIDGRTLRDLMDLGPLPLDRVRALGARLADALAYVHAHDLVHRDVKPSNILLDQDDDPFLADFGLAHLTGATRLTRTNQLVGTAAYLAPEQVLGQEIGHPADVYALGLVLVECLTGRREYQGGDVEAAVARLHRTPTIPEELPADVRGLLARMTSSAPEDRPTAHDCAQVLGGVPALPLAVEAEPGGDRATEELPRGARASWKALVASAGALVGAFALTLAATSGETPAGTAPPTSSTQQEAAPEQAGSSDPSQQPGNPQYIGTPRGSGATATATAPDASTSAVAPAADRAVVDTPEPVTASEEAPTTTVEPAPTTTAVPPTSNPPTTTAGTTEPSAEPEDPPSQPTEGTGEDVGEGED
ncbi:protein kinase [Saccharothrix sp. HUAS TT1]|uniref:serine/threonine-protein kinase n=1 Tax=unclassified Saccharothrix TaxID=2593673 RepID=UPI00345B91DE